MLGFILGRNTRELKNVITLKMLYCSLVRSHTEFGSIIWSQNSTDKLDENVQYKFLKSIAFCLSLPISRDSFLLVGDTIYIQPCEIILKLSDVLFIYDLLNNDIECSDLLSKIGICTHNYSIKNSCLFLYLFIEKNYVLIHFSAERFYYVIQFVMTSISLLCHVNFLN